jgi:nucleotide-binding universal stress UspA family protein
VATGSRSPVVVVHEHDDDADRSGVIVGIDGTEGSLAALTFAFEEASGRQCSLEVVHAWSLERAQGASTLAEDAMSTEYQVEQRRDLWVGEMLAGWGARYPDVPVTTSVVRGHALDALVRRSEDAELLVVGTHGRGNLASRMLGSVSRGVLRHARCPVAVVRASPSAMPTVQPRRGRSGHDRRLSSR